jgi:nicotinamide-nucleotide amidase
MQQSDNTLASLPSLVEILAKQLLANKLLLATAESCTGGGIATVLTDLAGSSGWFDAGFVTYSNSAKQRMLDVPEHLFAVDGPGAVSEETVRAMTAGAISNSMATVAVAVSGVAGPDGGSAAKPVGTVWIAWQLGDSQRAQVFHFVGDRAAVRAATVRAAILGLLELLEK